MQKIGAHVSSAGGVSNAPLNARQENCETFQFFIGSPKSYNFSAPSTDEITKFKASCQQYGYTDSYVHAPYLINLASGNNRTRHGSITLLRKNLEAANMLGVTGVMFHTGSGKDHPTKAAAIKKAIESINKVLDGYTGSCKLLIENAAGAGSVLGANFTEVGQLFTGVKNKKRLGVCLDTQHAFGSGYDWRTGAGTKAAIKEFDEKIGLKNLIVIQYNDSKVDCGSNRDRHEHIADGLMGSAAARNILQHPKLKNFSFCLETEPEGRAADIKFLQSIRV